MESSMTFREALRVHLEAIQARDLAAFAATLPEETLVLITSDGRLVRRVSEVLQMHAAWFGNPHWILDATEVHVEEAPALGVALLRLDYRETPPGGAPVRQLSYLTVIFRREGERWVLVQDQNTPVREPAQA
jgi:ketosteroid isomerase-like protein